MQWVAALRPRSLAGGGARSAGPQTLGASQSLPAKPMVRQGDARSTYWGLLSLAMLVCRCVLHLRKCFRAPEEQQVWLLALVHAHILCLCLISCMSAGNAASEAVSGLAALPQLSGEAAAAALAAWAAAEEHVEWAPMEWLAADAAPALVSAIRMVPPADETEALRCALKGVMSHGKSSVSIGARCGVWMLHWAELTATEMCLWHC